ncbi:MAG: nucleotidyltransferase domain-containing protein [Candidatus Aenigmarchaeota archaeon]|nr:nucleotidyltransferase domain-containing protein [Candidatus Aenigmarchaeota archaeon]
MPAIISAVRALQCEQLVVVKRGRVLTTVKACGDSTLFTRLKRAQNLETLYVSGLVDALSSAFRRPQAIICFGSYSRGDDIETSDVDIAVIGGKQTEPHLEKFEKIFHRTVSVHHIDLNRVSEEFKSNLCNGIVLEGAL